MTGTCCSNCMVQVRHERGPGPARATAIASRDKVPTHTYTPSPPPWPRPTLRTRTPDYFSVATHPPLARHAPTVEARPNQALRVSTCRPSLKHGVRRRSSSHPILRHPDPTPNLIPSHSTPSTHTPPHHTRSLLPSPPSPSPVRTPLGR